MRKEADIQIWKELYELAFEIKQRKPWDYLSDMDLIAVHPKGYDEPVYCCIMGSGGEYFAVACYVGQGGLNDLYSIVAAGNSPTPVHYIMMSQSNLTCTFGDRDEVSPQQKKIIKELGYRFRGKGNWVYFESYKPGYIPYIPDQQEVRLLMDVYPQLIQAIDSLFAEEIDVDFENGMCLMRRFDAQTGHYINSSVKVPDKEDDQSVYTLSNEVQKRQLKKKKQNNQHIIMDLCYMKSAVIDKKYDRPVLPQILFVVDWDTELILAADMLHPGDNVASAILTRLCDCVMKMGRFKAVILRNMLIYDVIEKTCEELGIEVAGSDEAMALMDDLIGEMMNFHM